MNKGFLAHLICAVFYCFAVIYIYQEEPIPMRERAVIVYLFILSQMVAALIAGAAELYSKTIHLKK